MSDVRELAMFPLQSVALPRLGLPLRVFEPRYLAMLDVVLASQDPSFGVTLIERGSEVGGGDVRSTLGTVATIVHHEPSPDGMVHLLAVGSARIDVVEWLPDDPYPKAVVRERPDGEWTAATDGALAAAEEAVRRTFDLYHELGEPVGLPADALADDALTRSWQLAGVLPVPILDKHALLGVDDPTERLRRLCGMADEANDVLALRLRGL